MLKTELAIFRERAEHAEELVAQLRPLAEERGRIAEELDLEKKRFRDISDDLMLKVRYRYLLSSTLNSKVFCRSGHALPICNFGEGHVYAKS